MALEVCSGLAIVSPFAPEFGGSLRPALKQYGDFVGLQLPKLTGPSFTVPILPGAALATGITFKIGLVNELSGDVGLVVRIGITGKLLDAGETLDMDTGAASEVATDVTLSATDGGLTISTIAITAANLDSLVSAKFGGLRIRRIGAHANDTAKGPVGLVLFGYLNT